MNYDRGDNNQSINQSIIYLNQTEAHKNRLDRQGK